MKITCFDHEVVVLGNRRRNLVGVDLHTRPLMLSKPAFRRPD
jgi:hypothetical protein